MEGSQRRPSRSSEPGLTGAFEHVGMLRRVVSLTLSYSILLINGQLSADSGSHLLALTVQVCSCDSCERAPG